MQECLKTNMVIQTSREQNALTENKYILKCFPPIVHSNTWYTDTFTELQTFSGNVETLCNLKVNSPCACVSYRWHWPYQQCQSEGIHNVSSERTGVDCTSGPLCRRDPWADLHSGTRDHPLLDQWQPPPQRPGEVRVWKHTVSFDVLQHKWQRDRCVSAFISSQLQPLVWWDGDATLLQDRQRPGDVHESVPDQRCLQEEQWAGSHRDVRIWHPRHAGPL